MPQKTNNIATLRNILFESLLALKVGASAEDIALAKAKSELAQTIINSAKVEVDFIRASGGKNKGTGFMTEKITENPAVEKKIPLPAGVSYPAPGITRHIMK